MKNSNYLDAVKIINEVKEMLDNRTVDIDDAWQKLYRNIPYSYILKDRDILEIITNLNDREYPKQLNMLLDLMQMIENDIEMVDVISKNQVNIKETVEKSKAGTQNQASSTLKERDELSIQSKKQLRNSQVTNVTLEALTRTNDFGEMTRSNINEIANDSIEEKKNDLENIGENCRTDSMELEINKVVQNTNVPKDKICIVGNYIIRYQLSTGTQNASNKLIVCRDESILGKDVSLPANVQIQLVKIDPQIIDYIKYPCPMAILISATYDMIYIKHYPGGFTKLVKSVIKNGYVISDYIPKESTRLQQEISQCIKHRKIYASHIHNKKKFQDNFETIILDDIEPEKFKFKLNSDKQINAVIKSPGVIKYIKNPSKLALLISIEYDSNNSIYSRYSYEGLVRDLMDMNYDILRYINKPSEKLKLEISKNKALIKEEKEQQNVENERYESEQNKMQTISLEDNDGFTPDMKLKSHYAKEIYDEYIGLDEWEKGYSVFYVVKETIDKALEDCHDIKQIYREVQKKLYKIQAISMDNVDLFVCVCLWGYIDGHLEKLETYSDKEEERFKVFYTSLVEKSFLVNTNNFKDVLLRYIKEKDLFHLEKKLKNEEIIVKSSNKSVVNAKSIKSIDDIFNMKGTTVPQRQEIVLKRIDRKQNLVYGLKNLYNNRCQVCGEQLEIDLDEYYSEVHHIKPLGSKHKGPDIIQNMIVLCSNCHTLFDRGAIGINCEDMSIIHCNINNKLNGFKLNILHEIGKEFILYHNEKIFTANKVENNYIKAKSCYTVDYGDRVGLKILESEEVIEIELEQHYNKMFMTEIQCALLGKNLNDQAVYLNNMYEIIKIEKR